MTPSNCHLDVLACERASKHDTQQASNMHFFALWIQSRRPVSVGLSNVDHVSKRALRRCEPHMLGESEGPTSQSWESGSMMQYTPYDAMRGPRNIKKLSPQGPPHCFEKHSLRVNPKLACEKGWTFEQLAVKNRCSKWALANGTWTKICAFPWADFDPYAGS